MKKRVGQTQANERVLALLFVQVCVSVLFPAPPMTPPFSLSSPFSRSLPPLRNGEGRPEGEGGAWVAFIILFFHGHHVGPLVTRSK